MSENYSSLLLRESVADEMSRELREQMALLSRHIESLLPLLKAEPWCPQPTSAQLTALLQLLREHGPQVAELPPDWQRLPEHRAYLSALHQLHAAVLQNQAALDGARRPAQALAERLELAAWRAMGDGLLLVDLHDGTALGDLAEIDPRPWWRKLRAWFRRR